MKTSHRHSLELSRFLPEIAHLGRRFSPLKTRLRKLDQDQDGAVSVEFTLWMPIFFSIFILVVDFTYLFMVDASMWEAARNAARSVAIHQSDVSTATATAKKSLVGDRDYNISIQTSTQDVTVRISLPASHAGLLGFATKPMSFDLVAYISMPREPV